MSFNISYAVNEQLNGITQQVIGTGVIARGSTEVIRARIKSGYRVIVKLAQNIDAHWTLAEIPDNYPARSVRVILKSNGDVVEIGGGSRSAAYTNILQPIELDTAFSLTHEGTSPHEEMPYTLTLVKYPTGNEEPIIPVGRGSNIIERAGELAPSASEVVFRTSSSFTLERFEFATNSTNGGITFVAPTGRGGDSTTMKSTRVDGSALVAGYYPHVIIETASSMWEINSYESGKNKFTLKQPLNFPKGVVINVINISSEIINMACSGYGRDRQ